MGITDGTKANSSAKPSTVPLPVITTDKNGSGGGPLPQMVITSPEEVEEELELKDVNGVQSPGEDTACKDVVKEEEEKCVDSHLPSSPSLAEEAAVLRDEKVEDAEQQQVPETVNDEAAAGRQADMAAAGMQADMAPVETTVQADMAPVETTVQAEATAPLPPLPAVVAQSATQRPLVMNGTEEPKPEVSCAVISDEQQVPLTTKPVCQSTVQRPLRIDGSASMEEPKAGAPSAPVAEAAEASKVHSQSATQRPLRFDAEAAKKSDTRVTTQRPESIYEVIEPKDSEIPAEQPPSPVHGHSDTQSPDKPKEGDGFLTKSKTFFKHDAKHLFSFPKFSFGSKEPKEPKASKKESASKHEDAEGKGESRKQEYSLAAAAAEAAKDSSDVVEKYRKLDENSALAETSVSAVQETKVTETATNVKCDEAVITTERSVVIHPVSKAVDKPRTATMKAEAENFELEQPVSKPPGEKRSGTPDSLYDTCCLKLASLIRNKAFEIATDVTRSSGPKKPPKPTPEALAKARAAVTAKKLQELESRHHTFGENLPAGYNGIRYADEDTESSTDYKDVENFGVIMNPECYGIIRKMKAENKSDSFRASSTCSGVTSYYTADSATLKDENSSDQTLETVSLGSCDSIVCRPASQPVGKKDAADEVAKTKGVDAAAEEKKEPSTLPISLVKKKKSPFASLFSSTKKKVPPPVPPKPSSLTKSPQSTKDGPNLPKSESKDVARCVNSLSLSPRPVHRTPSNSSAGIRKRPLTVAGVKDAEMLQYFAQSPESPAEPNITEASNKPVTLVKSDTPKAMRNLPIELASLSLSLSTPSRPGHAPEPEPAPKPKIKPEPPPRPPPPSAAAASPVRSKAEKPTPKPPETPKVPSATPVRKAPCPPRKPFVKQLVSPPRRPPPAAKPAVPPKKIVSPPPRPPPPAIKVAPKPDEQVTVAATEPDISKPDASKAADIAGIAEPHPENILLDSKDLEKRDVDLEEIPKEDSEKISEAPPPPPAVPSVQVSDVTASESEPCEEVKIPVKAEDVPQPEVAGDDKHSFEVKDESSLPSVESQILPRPPPRTRRVRSRTVEIVPVTQKVTDLRRSQSLSDADVEKRRETRRMHAPENPDLKILYTSVQKDPLKAKGSLTSPEDVGRRSPSIDDVLSRPLPPPPLPPRSKSRSSSRRSRSDERPSANRTEEHGLAKSESMPGELNEQVRPPARKKKGIMMQKFFTVGGKPRHPDAKTEKPNFYSLKLSKDTSKPPVRPERKAKHSPQPIHFDENANVADPTVDGSTSSVSGFTTSAKGSSPHYATPVSRPRGHSMGEGPVSAGGSNPKEKGSKIMRSVSEMPSRKYSSSWYDAEIDKNRQEFDSKQGAPSGSWEKLDWPGDGIMGFDQPMATPPRKKKQREKSKFYVNVPQSTTSDSAPESRLVQSDEPPQTDERSLGPDVQGSEDQQPQPAKYGTVGGHHYEAVSPTPPPSTPMEDKETSPLRLSCSEKSVQTSLETLSARGEASDDTDDLLDLAQTLQNELKTIITRHKFAEKSDDEQHSASDTVAEACSKQLSFPSKSSRLPNSSTSSSSELWQISSSEESDDDAASRSHSNLSEVSRAKKQKKIFYAAQEIVTSEETFVDALKLLNVDFRSFVSEMSKQRGSPIVPDEVLNQILNHLPQLQHLNENLLMELKDRIEHWDKAHKIADVIVKMGPFLKLYSWYIQDFEGTVSLLEESKRRYHLFGQCVKEFEMSAKCRRLTLNHYMLKPVQRIPQYRLLLQEYLHHLPNDSEDYEDTVEALKIVSDVANHANESMRQGDNLQKLISIQNSIMGHKEIIRPGRMFLKEGELMKLSRKGMQPRWFVLFNDLLLYLTPVQQGLYRINHELPLAGTKVAIPIQQDYQNEFSIISVTRSFTLAAKSPEERQEWIIALTKAIEENASKRSTFTTVRLQQKSHESAEVFEDEGFILGKKAPVWIPDARVTMCQLCTSEFTVTFRRHHCRACGKVICSVCSSNRISLQYLGNRIARVCDECYAKLGQGSAACTESGETDSDNQQIAVKSHLRSEHWHHKKHKRQLPSVLKEVCANDKGSTISGYMHIRVNKSWKRNWFVVKDKVLYEYRASEDVAALRSIPLLGYQINTFTESCEGIDACLLFELSHPGRPPILFHAETPGSAERWIKELRNATVLE